MPPENPLSDSQPFYVPGSKPRDIFAEDEAFHRECAKYKIRALEPHETDSGCAKGTNHIIEGNNKQIELLVRMKRAVEHLYPKVGRLEAQLKDGEPSIKLIKNLKTTVLWVGGGIATIIIGAATIILADDWRDLRITLHHSDQIQQTQPGTHEHQP